MKEDLSLDLCCCEYYDNQNQRNHILACCCNCVDIDEIFESIISGKSISETNRSGMMTTLRDRLRIPWRGGAKQVAFDTILPVFIIPTMFLISSISLWWTIFAFTTVLIFLMVTFNFFIKTIPQTKFFFMWTITSIVTLYVIMEFVVIPFLEILIEENLLLSLFLFWFIMCLYLMKVRTTQLCKIEDSAVEIENVQRSVNRFTICVICETRIPDKDHHCVWYDCCIGQHNQCLFIMSLVTGIISLLYSSNLTLTSVCHPYYLVNGSYISLLIPDDCSEVYFQFELALSFVSAIYSIGIAVLMLVLLVQQVILVSIGLSMKEWRKLPMWEKFCLGLMSKRPSSKGFVKNWSKIIYCNTSQYSVVNQL